MRSRSAVRSDLPSRRGVGRVGFCRGDTLLGRIHLRTANQERDLPIARCTLDSGLAATWPQILRATGS
jgi:hypothetical protein